MPVTGPYLLFKRVSANADETHKMVPQAQSTTALYTELEHQV